MEFAFYLVKIKIVTIEYKKLHIESFLHNIYNLMLLNLTFLIWLKL